ncbi:MAG: orotidine-5'-phosphate decarboxylase [Neisseriaceae bacterium]|nr:orotidine-5'-phosphate decarboxylase [Neisseriaceae bacterium]
MNPLIFDTQSQKSDPKIIVALDFPNEKQTVEFVRLVSPEWCRLKIGKELFTATGASLVEKLMTQGFEIFLDLKFHDIPNTVANACRSAAELGVWLVDMHASGGKRMMEAAANAVANFQNRPKLIAVTVLTSMTADDLAEIGIQTPVEQQVLKLAQLAQHSDLDGIVCSAQEAALLRQQIGNDFLLVTPGIRPASNQTDDQRRTMTPLQAINAGSSYLVIGRPITQAKNPLQALMDINNSIQAA